MPFIENVSFADIKKAWHYDPGPNNLWICIVDPDMEFPEPRFPFKTSLKLKFLDLEEEDTKAITKEQANQIAVTLKQAFKNNTNIIVNCVMGVSRSGAIVEAALALGFEDTEKYRNPNIRVKSFIMEHLNA